MKAAPLLLGDRRVSITGRIRHRLVTVILLGVITSAVSLVALVRVISQTEGYRVERGRIGVQSEVNRLATDIEAPARSALIGARGGVATSATDPLTEVPVEWRSQVRDVLERATGPQAVTHETALSNGVLIVAARAVAGSPTSKTAWVAYLVPPPIWLRTWQIIVVALALATGLLVSTAIAAVITVKRGAAALTRALDGLATDLSTPVPRPRLHELSDVADGIARLAQRLARAREVEDDMGRQLAMKDRLAALGRVVAGVAHEVRNPLASIKLRLDLAKGGADPLPAPVDEAIAHATREITRLDRLVADLLVVANPGIGPRQSVALGALVRTRADLLEPWCNQRGVAIQVRGDAAAPVDVDALSRAVDNLVRNAVEASSPGSIVDVELTQATTQVSIAVIDQGVGVPDERTPELFEPFFTTKPTGTGLGLAICRSIARAHGGDVTFARKGALTCFQLVLARAPAARGDGPLAAS